MFVHRVKSFNGYAPGLYCMIRVCLPSYVGSVKVFCLHVQTRSLCRTMWLVALEGCFIVYCSHSVSCRSEGHHF